MTNLLTTIAPKSDQLNADDLIGRSLTITVSKVSLCGEPDQPVAVHYDGDNGKPYKPCKSMRRVMVHVWGGDGSKFVGRRMSLYRDEKVMFGGQAVGGIRISHMSDIDRDITLALTATRANRKPYTVRPLQAAKGAPVESVDLLPILTEGREAAKRGSAALAAWWQRLTRDEKAAAKPALDGELKPAASAADLAALGEETPETIAANPGGDAGEATSAVTEPRPPSNPAPVTNGTSGAGPDQQDAPQPDPGLPLKTGADLLREKEAVSRPTDMGDFGDDDFPGDVA